MGREEEMIQDIFSTPIYMNRVSNYEKIQKELERVKGVFDTEIGWDDLWDSHLITDNKFEDNLIEQYNLTAFKDEIRTHVVSYIEQVNGKKTEIDVPYRITASWMTRYDKGHFAVCHEHGFSDMAGVYYYQTDTKDGDIYFQTPVQAKTTSFWDARPSTESFPPEQGGIILFPGWLRHGVQSNTTDHTRMSVSFNITFARP
jgi:uncharacterized protein (TIGR02466 family)